MVLPNSFISMALGNIDWIQVATVVLAGFLIVFGVLLALILIFYVFGFVVSKTVNSGKKGKKNKAEEGKPSAPAITPAPKSVAQAPAPVVEDGVSGEVVAAITAAIVASEGTGRPFTIRSIRKKSVSGRNPWANAAVADNTKPF